MNTTTVRIIECTSATELYRRYDSQTEAQPCYIELDLREGTMLADWNGEVGDGVPGTVRHGFERRYSIPVLTADAANRTLAELAPLADRILADWEQEWDGSNMVARLGEDARAAEGEIQEQLGVHLGYGDRENQGFDEADIVTEWDVDGATNGNEAQEFGITASTTDERLEEIEAEIGKGLADVGGSGVVVLDGVGEYLRQVRRDQADAVADDDSTGVEGPDGEVAVWSVVRGESPRARAVEPGPIGVDVPGEILAWAQGHGLRVEDPEVYLLVTPRAEAGEVIGEIAWREYRMPAETVTAIQGALDADA